MIYLGLFFASFTAATLLPGGSEVLLVALLNQGYAIIGLFLAASIGNTLGSVVNYFLGSYFIHFQDRKWFPISAKQAEQAQKWFGKYGQWSLLFAWLPIVGDPLTLYAGMMKMPFWRFLILVWLGKSLRYAIIISLFLSATQP